MKRGNEDQFTSLKNQRFDMISRLDWDSEMFKMTIGVSNISTYRDVQLSDFKKQFLGYDLVYLLSHKKVPDFEGQLFEDERIKYVKNVSFHDLKTQVSKVKFGIHKKSNFEKLALLSGRFSRFHLDPKFDDEKFILLYNLWLGNYFLNDSSKEVFFCQESGIIQGFLTLDIDYQEQTGTIDLVAVDEQFQGQGIGTTLIRSVENYLISEKIKTLYVTTQGCNDQAKRLYEKNQFEIDNVSFVYHLWKA